MKFDTTDEAGYEDPTQNKLLETYMKIVKTGAPEEIEEFSKIERQKLVELLCTNQDLLNFMYDKMFVNNDKSVPPEVGEDDEDLLSSQENFGQ